MQLCVHSQSRFDNHQSGSLAPVKKWRPARFRHIHRGRREPVAKECMQWMPSKTHRPPSTESRSSLPVLLRSQSLFTLTAVARFVGVPVRQAMVIFFSSNENRFFAQRSIRFRRVAHTDALNFSDFDSLLLRASALVMTGDKVWYLLLKAKQDVRFSFLRITAMSAKRHLQVGKNSMLASHSLSDLHGLRSRRRKLRFAW